MNENEYKLVILTAGGTWLACSDHDGGTFYRVVEALPKLVDGTWTWVPAPRTRVFRAVRFFGTYQVVAL